MRRAKCCREFLHIVCPGTHNPIAKEQYVFINHLVEVYGTSYASAGLRLVCMMIPHVVVCALSFGRDGMKVSVIFTLVAFEKMLGQLDDGYFPLLSVACVFWHGCCLGCGHSLSTFNQYL